MLCYVVIVGERKKIIGEQSEPRGSLGWGRVAETKHKANPALMRFAWRTETMVLPDQSGNNKTVHRLLRLFKSYYQGRNYPLQSKDSHYL